MGSNTNSVESHTGMSKSAGDTNPDVQAVHDKFTADIKSGFVDTPGSKGPLKEAAAPTHGEAKMGALVVPAMLSVGYVEGIHPELQKIGIPAQLKIDARAAAGELTPLSKTVNYIPKAYLNAFSPSYVARSNMASLAESGANENTFISVAGRMMGPSELEAITKATATEGGTGFLGKGLSVVGTKIGIPLAIVGAESLAQNDLARSLADNDNATFKDHLKNEAARIVEPTLTGGIAKDIALMLGSDIKTKAITFAGAQLYEAESNMTHTERFGTMIASLAPAAIALARESKPIAIGLAVADVGIGLAAEQTSNLWSKEEKTLPAISTAATKIQDVNSAPIEIRYLKNEDHPSMKLRETLEDPLLCHSIYDQAHTPAVKTQK
jgi:hypothetical protein